MAVQTIVPQTAISAGQRFSTSHPGPRLVDSELVVDRWVRDDLGMLHVILLDLEGREISLFAEQFEVAIDGGQLTPVDTQARQSA